MSAGGIVIETKDLSRSFKEVEAVRGLNLQIGQGEIFGLIGPDGSGKTTTIRLLAAILDPTAGWARVGGFDTVTEPEPIKRSIGYMAQRFNLYSDLSVSENLNFFADIFDVRGGERRERIERLLRFARLEAFRDRRAGHLSGGMQKKLALACTLVHTPQILFLDEPTTGVDPVSRREFWHILTELHVQGITLVISTPYMDEAERCNRVALMYRGELMICEAPSRIRSMAEVKLIAINADDPRRARTILAELEGVREAHIYGDQLRISVDDGATIPEKIASTLSANGIVMSDMRPVQPRMEEAFISLIRGRTHANQT